VISNRKPSRRAISLELLEDRLVLSSAASVASAAALTFQQQNAELTQLNTQVNPIYSSFASAVFQAESTFDSATTGTGTGTTTTTPAAALSTLETTVSQQITTLSSALVTPLTSLTGTTTNLTTQVQAQLTGSSPGSLANQMTSLFTAASSGTTDGSVPQASYPLLFTAINDAVSASYSSTAVDAYYFVTGQGGTTFDLPTVATLQNTAWTTFASAVFQAESTLVNPAGSSTGSPVVTAATVSTQVTQAANTLSQSIASSFASTPASGNTAAIQALFTDPGASSLSSQLTSLLSAASSGTTDGSVPQASLPLLFAAVDAAIEASYNTTAVSSYLLAVSPT
jgi:trimeric autotransporter adhesin